MAFLSEKLISASAAEETDDDFNLVTGLYKFDGSNGAQNNTLLDSSSESHTVTRNADIVQGTFSPFSSDEGKWSIFFDGTDDYIDVGSSNATQLGSGDFTVEFWIRTSDTSCNIANPDSATGSGYWGLMVQSGDLRWNDSYAVTNKWVVDGAGILDDVWHHVAIVRNSGTIAVYYDGTSQSVQSGSFSDSTDYSGSDGLRIGSGNLDEFTGNISNFRTVSGTAVYTSNYSAPSTPLTAITNTKVLVCCSNRFRDKSTSAHSITFGSTPKIQPFSPFAPSGSYSALSKGGSGFFDGTSDCWLTVSDATDFDFGTGDYTIEAWFYPTVNGSSFTLPFAIEGGNNYWGWTSLGSGYNGLTNHTDTLDSSSGADSESPDKFGWNHIVYQVTSGTNNWYKNGVQVYSGTAATHANATGFRVGRSPSYNNHYYGGYISDVRIVKGSNVYSNASTLTIPTAPLTAVTNTKLLLNFTNAAIFDQTGKSNINTVGNAQLDTSVKKFGTASAEFDGTDDYIEVPPSTAISPQRGSWTYECFIYPKTVVDSAGYGCIFDTRTNNPDDDGVSLFYVGTASQKRLECYGPATGGYYFSTANNSITLDQWQHVALVFDLDATNYPITCYVNGTSVGSSTSNTWYTRNSGRLRIGAQQAGYNEFTGFIDEFRVTNKARYTSNFTAPTKEFLNL